MVGWSGLLGNRQLLTRSGLPVPAHGPKGGAGPSAVPARPSPAQRVNSTSAAGGIICFSLVEFRSLLPHPFPPSLPSSRAPAPRRSRYLSYHRSLSLVSCRRAAAVSLALHGGTRLPLHPVGPRIGAFLRSFLALPRCVAGIVCPSVFVF